MEILKSDALETSLPFPLVDYHVHLSKDLDIEQAVELSEARNVRFGILEHPGASYGLQNDADLEEYINHLRQYPVYVGLQPVHLGWAEAFSSEVIDQLDYVLMDADTIPQQDGSYMLIWQNTLFIHDMDAFVRMYMDHIIQILSTEPISIFGRPTYLPINFARHYDEIWTKKRMMTIIDLARERNIALEIQENTRIPSVEFIKLAKEAGVKFTFGTNARNHNAGNFSYCVAMAIECGLTEGDMFWC
jgi:histidinol phosphatase-like PHP family hydrolase